MSSYNPIRPLPSAAGETFAVRAEAACPRCGGTEVMTIPCRPRRGPHEFERCCAACGAHRDWAAKRRAGR